MEAGSTNSVLTIRLAEETAKARTYEMYLNTLLTELESKGPQVASQKANYEELIKAYVALKTENAELKTKQTQLEQQIASWVKSHGKIRAERDDLSAVCEHQRQQITSLLTEIHCLKNGGERSTSSPAQAFLSIEELTAQNTTLLKRLSAAQSESVQFSLTNQVDDLKEQVASLESQIALIEERDVQYPPAASAEKLEQLEEALTQKTEESNQLHQMYSQAQAESMEYKFMAAQRSIELSVQRAEHLTTKANLSQSQTALNSEQSRNVGYKMEKLENGKKLAAAESSVRALEAENECLQQQVQSLERQRQTDCVQYQNSLLAERAARHSEITDREASCRQQVQAEIEALKTELAAYREHRDTSTGPQQLELLTSMYRELQTQYLDLLKNKGRGITADTTTALMPEFTETLRTQSEEIKGLQHRHAQDQRRISEQASNLADATIEIDEYRAIIQRLQSDIHKDPGNETGSNFTELSQITDAPECINKLLSILYRSM